MLKHFNFHFSIKETQSVHETQQKDKHLVELNALAFTKHN